MTFDFRCRLNNVERADRSSEAVYLVQGSLVKDATLGGRIQMILVNSTASVP